jgi:hypothetical protein
MVKMFGKDNLRSLSNSRIKKGPREPRIMVSPGLKEVKIVGRIRKMENTADGGAGFLIPDSGRLRIISCLGIGKRVFLVSMH